MLFQMNLNRKERAMSVYIIVSYDIKDPKVFENYVPGVRPLLQKHGAEILVSDREAKTLEGQGRGVNVVLKFESEEAAMGFYNDPDYGPVKKIRQDSTENGTVILAKQFVPPSE
jgi:uncharacterized protein (DUF1330 family)